MIRYHLFGSGRTWITEYGSAEDKDQFAVLYAYSPYHRLVKDTAYPALLMLAPESDDRVDPMHARKFVAAAQWATSSAAPVLLRVSKGGHKGADLVRETVAKNADTLSFLMQQLGM
jgi:prolyl oligopeptidase